MNIQVDIDAAKALLRLDKGYKRMLFSVVKAINETGLTVQKDVRARISSAFTVRVPFTLRQVKHFGASFSTSTGVGKWEARVGIGIGAGLDKGGKFLLPRYETGGLNVPGPGRRTVPVPVGARPTKASPILPQFTFKAMGLKAYRGAKLVRRPGRSRSVERGFGTGGAPVPSFSLTGVQFKGRGGTFLIKGPGGRMGIFQRTGGALRLIWAFVPNVRLDTRLKFYETARRTINRSFARNLQSRINESFARHG